MLTNYSRHAVVWDWDGFDRSEEFEFWKEMASPYGRRILSAMGAIGEAGAYLAKRGCDVTVLDYTKEMIAAGKTKFAHVKRLSYVHADVSDFRLPSKEFDFCFVASADLHVLPSLDFVEKALKCVHEHLRIGGGLGLELWYPPEESISSPMRRFEPRVPRKDGIHVWKEGKSQYDAVSKKQEIHQIVHIESAGRVKSFQHFVTLQLYDRDVLLNVFNECGFRKIADYSDHKFNVSANANMNNFVELTRT